MIPKVRSSLIALVVFLLCATAFMASYTFWRSEDVTERPVHIIISAKLTTPVVKRGGPLSIEFVITRTVRCEAVVHRFIIRASDNVIVWSSIVPGIEGMGENFVVRRSFLFPREIAPGEYYYRSEVHSNGCAFKGPQRNVPPSTTGLLPFIVED